MNQEHLDIANELVMLKNRALKAGLFRTVRMIDIACQEVGWELQGVLTPPEQQRRQKEALNIE